MLSVHRRFGAEGRCTLEIRRGGGGKKDYMMVGIGETGKQVHVIHY